MNDDQYGLPIDELEVIPEDNEAIAGKIANGIFRPWYKEYYEGRYTQPVGYITKTLKQAVLSVVVEGEEDEEVVRLAMNHLGQAQGVISPNSLQYAMGWARKYIQERKDAGAYASDNLVPRESFTDFLNFKAGRGEEIDYGQPGDVFW